MKLRRSLPVLVALGLSIAACGAAESTSTTETEPAATEAASDDVTPTVGSDVVPVTSEPAGTAAPLDTEVPASTDTPPTDSPAPENEAPATDAPSTAPAPAPAGGRALATEVGSESRFEANPFPDLVVDDVGRGGVANIANILPSERPVLLWTWAPH